MALFMKIRQTAGVQSVLEGFYYYVFNIEIARNSSFLNLHSLFSRLLEECFLITRKTSFPKCSLFSMSFTTCFFIESGGNTTHSCSTTVCSFRDFFFTTTSISFVCGLNVISFCQWRNELDLSSEACTLTATLLTQNSSTKNFLGIYFSFNLIFLFEEKKKYFLVFLIWCS